MILKWALDIQADKVQHHKIYYPPFQMFCNVFAHLTFFCKLSITYVTSKRFCFFMTRLVAFCLVLLVLVNLHFSVFIKGKKSHSSGLKAKFAYINSRSRPSEGAPRTAPIVVLSRVAWVVSMTAGIV